MQGLGERLRERARALGWTDTEVARRAGLAQTRYSNYVNDLHEPDLATFTRICAVLAASPADLLAPTQVSSTRTTALRRRITAAAEALDAASLQVAATVLDALVARSAGPRAGGRQRLKVHGRTEA